jgi:single-strand DNA-binding protein
MSSINKVLVLGRLGKDPEVRYTSDGKIVASFSVATSTVSKDKMGVKTEHTEWHRMSAFNSAGEVASKYLKKGDQVFVEGSLRTKKWNDNGVDRYATEITVGRLTLLGNKTNTESTNLESIDDDVPF